MKKIKLFSCFLMVSLMLGSCGSTSSVTGNNEKFENLEISETEVSNTLKYLSSNELMGRKTGTEGIEQAAEYIENIFRKNNIEPYFEDYRDSFLTNGTTGYNLVGYIEGSDPELKDQFIIIGAHYDHIGIQEKIRNDSIANGANDNATGTTAVLELAKYFADKEPKRSILFTLFSAEELGLVGAKHLARRLNNRNLDLYVMFNIEMIGVPMTDKSYTAYLTGYNKSNLAEKFNEYAGQEVLGFLPQAQEYQLFMRSDNHPFYEEFGVPAQTISTFDFTNYPYYHHVDDEFEFMNVPHIAQLIEEIIPGIAKMANTEKREIKMTN